MLFTNIISIVTKKNKWGEIMTTVRMVFDIDEDLRTEINIIAKRNKTTVKAIMNQLVEDYVNENK